MVWFDRSGKEIAKIGSSETATPAYPSISPDYRRVAVQRSIGGNTDIWLIELARGLGIRFTSDPVPDIAPVWSPDGQRIVFSSLGKGGVFDLYQKLVTGTASQELIQPTLKVRTGHSILSGKLLTLHLAGRPLIEGFHLPGCRQY